VLYILIKNDKKGVNVEKPLMSSTKIHLVVGIHNVTLTVFYTEKDDSWQFRLLSPGGAVFGELKLYFTPEAAEKAAREWMKEGN
jgi:hypothetical protein